MRPMLPGKGERIARQAFSEARAPVRWSHGERTKQRRQPVHLDGDNPNDLIVTSRHERLTEVLRKALQR